VTQVIAVIKLISKYSLWSAKFVRNIGHTKVFVFAHYCNIVCLTGNNHNGICLLLGLNSCGSLSL